MYPRYDRWDRSRARQDTTLIKLIFSLIIIFYLAIVTVIRINKEVDSSSSSLTTQQYSDLAQFNLDYNLNNPKHKTKELFTDGCTYTVLLVQHCEYNSLTASCNYLGQQRAQHLATLFGPNQSTPWPVPTQLYILDQSCNPNYPWFFFHRCPGHNRSRRHVETLLPLQEQTQSTMNYTDHANILYFNNPAALAKHIFDQISSTKNIPPSICSRVVVVVTSSIDVPRLALELGCGPLNAGCPRAFSSNTNSSLYDYIWELSFVYTETGSNNGNSSMTWSVFGNIVRQNFDPLSFSTHVLGLYEQLR